jgi:isopenicillin-N N-acyltransferase-like protein
MTNEPDRQALRGAGAKSHTSDGFPQFDLAGSPTDIGLAYGRQAGNYVHRSVAIYQNAFAQKGVSWEQARRRARAFAPQIGRYNQAFLEELEAIARGAELPLDDVIAINARTELLYGQKPAAPHAPETDVDGCTGAIALPEATADQHMLHGQNWDWRDECADASVVLRIQPDQGPRMLIFVEAGILARCGMNSAGVAVTGNFLQTDRDYGHDGVPVPLIRRRVLMSAALGEAIRAVYDAPRSFSNNLMISQRDGEAVDLEATPGEVFWILPERGLLVHANHFTSVGALAKVHDRGLETNADSLYRDRRVRACLSSRAGRLEPDDFKTAFADRYGTPRAVCRSPVLGPGGKSSSTVATIVMDTTAGRMWIAKRPYDEPVFREYAMD